MFSAEWNEPCKAMKKPFRDMARARKMQAVFCLVDIDKLKVRIRRLPALIFLYIYGYGGHRHRRHRCSYMRTYCRMLWRSSSKWRRCRRSCCTRTAYRKGGSLAPRWTTSEPPSTGTYDSISDRSIHSCCMHIRSTNNNMRLAKDDGRSDRPTINK